MVMCLVLFEDKPYTMKVRSTTTLATKRSGQTYVFRMVEAIERLRHALGGGAAMDPQHVMKLIRTLLRHVRPVLDELHRGCSRNRFSDSGFAALEAIHDVHHSLVKQLGSLISGKSVAEMDDQINTTEFHDAVRIVRSYYIV